MDFGKKLFFFFCLCCVFLLGKAAGVLALEIKYPEIFGQNINSTSTIAEYVCYIIGLLINLAIFIALIMVAYGGIHYLIAYSRGKFTDDGKDIIKSGLLGLLIVVSSSLIVYTINPNLTSCKIGVLSFINLDSFDSYSAPHGVNIHTYKEIPIGILTENLLTRKMNSCYGFDQRGNPVDGNPETEILEPTYLDHDRADCLVQLIDGAQKKANEIASLSDEIIKLMNQCNCLGKCRPNSPCDTCSSGSCMQVCGCSQLVGNDCCPPGVKDKIEHGPISAAVDVCGDSGCKTEYKTYKGLDEFRCTQSEYPFCFGVSYWVELPYVVDLKLVTIIRKDGWDGLNLINQLRYFYEKIDQIKQEIEDDQEPLDQARSVLDNCYLAMPYANLIKNYKTTKNNYDLLLTQKTFIDPQTEEIIDASKYCQGFNYANSSCFKKCNDMCPDSSEQALASYSNCGACKASETNCLQKQEECIKKAYNKRPCPYALFENSPETFEKCMSSCQLDCSTDCGQKYLPCSSEYYFCDSQCKDNGQCVLDDAGNCLFGSQNFQYCGSQFLMPTDMGNAKYCINNAYLCKNGSNQYSGYSNCVDTIGRTEEDHSECSLNNYSASYLFSNPNCQKCFNPYKPAEKDTSCYSKKSPYSSCQEVCPETAKCPTSSDCPYCPCESIDQTLSFYKPNKSFSLDLLSWTSTVQNIIENTVKENTDNIGSVIENAWNSYWESIRRTIRGIFNPGNYKTKEDIANEVKEVVRNTTQTAITNNIASAVLSSRGNAGKAGYTTLDEQISAFQMAGPECNSYSFNHDPLTFYCEDNWWDNPNKEGADPEPMGKKMFCSEMEEIPMGQTIDSARNWADSITGYADAMEENIQSVFEQLVKIWAVKEIPGLRDYCKCNAKSQYGVSICTSECVPILDACVPIPCLGNPCDQLINYLSELWNEYRHFKSEFIEFYTAMITEPRSDIVKELTYSRQKTNNCNVISNIYKENSKMMSCTRAQDELMDPINSYQMTKKQISAVLGEDEINLGSGKTILSGYCYGKEFGDLFGKSLTDNWFCCEKTE